LAFRQPLSLNVFEGVGQDYPAQLRIGFLLNAIVMSGGVVYLARGIAAWMPYNPWGAFASCVQQELLGYMLC
jgi:hypothetical protein